ncbi:MAG: ThuA domain-containing protein [Tenuifilaceae bacterium]|jgi:type 1 glutamine amidotransferase|nr:ThuA domain-containing protein [Tenuifilaceae bacterium]
MKLKLLFALAVSATLMQCATTPKPKSLLVVAGGHRFDTLTFFSLFKDIEGFVVDTAMQPAANQLIAQGKADSYDAIVFYDSWRTIADDEKEGYRRLLSRGVGMVFMHHALVSYQHWDEFPLIIGGKYKKPRFKGDTTNLSDFMHDIQMHVVCNPNHPITASIPNFDIHDEGYMNIDILPSITSILTTQHQHCDSIIGWTHQVNRSRVVYLMPGHDRQGLTTPSYRKIIVNSIKWVSEKE